MTVRFNHTIVAAKDPHASARFFADLFGLGDPEETGPFVAVHLADDAQIDFAAAPGDIEPHHYAFLVDEDDFDALYARIVERRLPHWADPRKARTGINHHHGGRGVYFEDPDGHYLEAITRPYGWDLRPENRAG